MISYFSFTTWVYASWLPEEPRAGQALIQIIIKASVVFRGVITLQSLLSERLFESLFLLVMMCVPLVSSSNRMMLGFLTSHSCFVTEVGAETGTFLIETEITPQWNRRNKPCLFCRITPVYKDSSQDIVIFPVYYYYRETLGGVECHRTKTDERASEHLFSCKRGDAGKPCGTRTVSWTWFLVLWTFAFL